MTVPITFSEKLYLKHKFCKNILYSYAQKKKKIRGMNLHSERPRVISRY